MSHGLSGQLVGSKKTVNRAWKGDDYVIPRQNTWKNLSPVPNWEQIIH